MAAGRAMGYSLPNRYVAWSPMTLIASPYRLEVRQSAIDRRGCFAAEPVPADGLVGEYTGELISAAEAVRREADPSRASVFTFWLDDEWVIDGLVGGNATIYINHSCAPNCYAQVVDGVIWIRASKTIERGQELTYNYQTDGSKTIACRCRPGCRTRL